MTRRIAVIGANGFIGKNLLLRLSELNAFELTPIARDTAAETATAALRSADCIINLAGVNRVVDEAELLPGNLAPLKMIAEALRGKTAKPDLIHVSSSRAGEDNPYGAAKFQSERYVQELAAELNLQFVVLRPPNVFGKWCRPNYNSAVATFCHNVARRLPIKINDPSVELSLIYVDDLVDKLIGLAASDIGGATDAQVGPIYSTTVGQVAELIQSFHQLRSENLIADVGTGLVRALYSTYVAALPTDHFSYPLVSHKDHRGAFSEVLKTRVSGQFSYFSALPGVTRGGHYHHSKVEKFLVVHGAGCFRFRHVLTDERFEIRTSAEKPMVVETIPGWAHDVTNVGQDVMVCLLWANELFNRDKPDTIVAEL
jgi:UDP-2-acetamido-2,6-beta-L-arabino-hexul-4-ose reductase